MLAGLGKRAHGSVEDRGPHRGRGYDGPEGPVPAQARQAKPLKQHAGRRIADDRVRAAAGQVAGQQRDNERLRHFVERRGGPGCQDMSLALRHLRTS